jgi:hypothetical protein
MLQKECYGRGARFDNAIDPVIVSLEGVESNENDSTEEDKSSEAWDKEMGGITLITGSTEESSE